ncbi:serine/threonine-protein phosphatase 4 regulatory subunit 1-like [Phodopus roborovskii]|uniref:serine/threonine-protein phosphatase 4 regulatory subunit 1-like n=1 Tax=Phodopus roborovskii TaxID=109678 RepID=UPI0021E3D026|nr:serine/threonine-protein phosphatase 4 regulatory subunit 1-like [Phodopus roborovskii]
MARAAGVRARRRPKLRRERPGPAPASPGAAEAPPSPGCVREAAVRPPPPFAAAEPPLAPRSHFSSPDAAPGHLTSPPTSAATFSARAGRAARGSQARKRGGRSAEGRSLGVAPPSGPAASPPGSGRSAVGRHLGIATPLSPPPSRAKMAGEWVQPIPRWRVSGSGLRGLRAAPLPLPVPAPAPRARDPPPAQPRVTPCVPFDFSEAPLYFEDLQDDLDDYGFEDCSPDCGNGKVMAFLDAPGHDNLPLLTRLEKHAFSENVLSRQIVARGLLDVFRDVGCSDKDALAVMEVAVRLSEDAEPTVRTELMEQIPPIVAFLQESRLDFPVVVSQHLVPVIVRYLSDADKQVRKSSQEVLLALLEQDLISQCDVEGKVCPVLLERSGPDRDDECRAEAISTVCRMASMLPKSTVTYQLLPRFCELCADGKLFQVRKVCATHFGDICHAVGQEATEKFLIPTFFELCSDNMWGMRKACAECFMAVSYNTSPEVRRAQLSPLFIKLISDPCRWVRQAAFQSLGPFISTFANPSRAGLYIREDGTLSTRPPSQGVDSDFASGAPTPSSFSAVSLAGSKTPVHVQPDLLPEGTSAETSHLHASTSSSDTTESQLGSPSSARAEMTMMSTSNCPFPELPGVSGCPSHSHPETEPGTSETTFSTFLHWRAPLPDISEDVEVLLSGSGPLEESHSGPEAVCDSYVARNEIQRVLQSLQGHLLQDPDIQAQVQVLSAALRATQLDSTSDPESKQTEGLSAESASDPSPASDNHILPSASSSQNELSVARILQSTDQTEPQNGASGHLGTEQGQGPTALEESKAKVQVGLHSIQCGELLPLVSQDIIPQPLLDQFVSMTDPARAQTVDTDIAKHCAYSLPGVALTLGRQNWHCLKGTYETLASDGQWKVRRTLAFSIHELAVILGDQLTAADLVPIFSGFLKDLDEVRVGVLKHLYDFLKLLHEDKRRAHLRQLQEFVVTDNDRNWRLRYELAEQLILILDLYGPSDVHGYLRHVALKLCADKVSQVRWISFKLVAVMLRKFYSHGASALGLSFIQELTSRFRHCPKWVGRQAFACICQAVVTEDSVPVDQFVEHLLPSLLSLAADPVPNVRVLLAKALRQTLLEKAYFRNAWNHHLEVVEETLLALQSDPDQDVSFFASLEPKMQNATDTTVPEN